MTREEEKLNDNEQLALKIAEELSEGREFECDSLDIYKGAMKMADWKEQQMIEKMINWLALHAELYGSFNGGKLNEMAVAIKKAMED